MEPQDQHRAPRHGGPEYGASDYGAPEGPARGDRERVERQQGPERPEQPEQPERQEHPPRIRGAGTAGLSLPSRLVVGAGAVVVALAVAVHVAMVFLHVAPPNTVSKQHSRTIDGYVYPEFEQNWKLFAPNPLQQNIAVHARALVSRDDGTTATTRWTDLTAQDGAGVRHNVAPSHTQQNELRRAWEFFTGAHDSKGKPLGLRGRLSERYIKRIVMYRFRARQDGGAVERIQVRSAVTPVSPPSWSGERTKTKAEYRTQPWWQVTSADLPRGGASGGGGKAAGDPRKTGGPRKSGSGNQARSGAGSRSGSSGGDESAGGAQ